MTWLDNIIAAALRRHLLRRGHALNRVWFELQEDERIGYTGAPSDMDGEYAKHAARIQTINDLLEVLR